MTDFDGCHAYRRYIAKDRPFWSTIRSLEEDLLAMADRYNPARPLRMNGALSNEAILITNPLGVQGMNATVQNIGAPETGHTPVQKPRDWYDDSNNSDTYLGTRQRCCVGACLVRPFKTKDRMNRTTRESEMVVMPMRRRCAFCNEKEAHLYCTNCHHWFRDNTAKLPSTEQRMIAIPTGKRSADGGEKYMFAENNCAHAWHARARQSAMMEMSRRDITQLALVPFRRGHTSVRAGEEGVEVVRPADSDSE